MTAVAHAPSEHLDRRGRLHVSDRFDEKMARLDSIDETVRANGAKHDAEGRLASSTIEALKSARAFDIGVPVEVGGLEFSPRQVIAVIERITEPDAATGWVVMALKMITGTTAAYLGDEATRELFSGSDYPLMQGKEPSSVRR